MPLQWRGPSWPWSYGSWTYNYLCNQCLSPLMLWVRILIRASCTTLCDKVCQWLATGWWFSLDTSVSSINKADHNITEILLKVALNTIKQTLQWRSHHGHDHMVSSTNKADCHYRTEILLKVALNTIKQTLQWRGHHGHDHMVSSTNKADCHYRTEILLKVALNTIKQTLQWRGHKSPISVKAV
jgi:hypothetical protein